MPQDLLLSFEEGRHIGPAIADLPVQDGVPRTLPKRALRRLGRVREGLADLVHDVDITS